MPDIVFVDTNIFLRHLRNDHPEMSPKATAFLQRVEHGDLKARTADTVVFEIVYTLQRTYKTPKPDIQNALLSLLALPGIVLPRKQRYRKVFEYYVHLNISFADAYHAVLMEELKLDTVVSFDTEFDRVARLTRTEP